MQTRSDRAPAVVVIPFYQRERGILRRAVESALAQRHVPNLQVIVVDDGSPLPAREDIGDLLENGAARITLVSQRNGGPGAARNAGLDHVPPGTEYVAFLDSDNRWVETHLDNALTALESGSDFYFADLKREWHDETTFNVRSDFWSHGELADFLPDRGIYEYRGDFEWLALEGLVLTSTIVYRYSRFPEARFPTEFATGEDIFFWLIVGRKARRPAMSLNCEGWSGRGVNLYWSALSRRSTKYVRLVSDEIACHRRCLRVLDLGPAARQVSRRMLAQDR